MKRLLLFLTLILVAMPTANGTIISRSQLDHPALGTAGGSTLHALITAIYEILGDQANSRYSIFASPGDSATLEVDHNFGVNLTELSVLIYSGTTGNYTRITEASSPALSLYTIQEKAGDEKTIIEIITPAASTPSDLLVFTIQGRGSEKLDDLDDVDLTTAPEDGQALVFDGVSQWVPGASGDASFKIQGVVDPDATIKGGKYGLTNRRQLASYDGAGSVSTDFQGDLVCDLDVVFGAPANDTTYNLFIDLNLVGNTAITTTDTAEEFYAVECADMVMFTDFPEGILGSRYVPVGFVHTADAGNAWSGTGAALNTFAFRLHDQTYVNTSPVIYEQAAANVLMPGSNAQFSGGHTLATNSFQFTFADDVAFWNFQADSNDDSGATSCAAGAASCDLTNNGTVPFTGTNLFGASGVADLNGSSMYFSNSDAFLDAGDADFTMFLWVQADDYTPVAIETLFFQGDDTADKSFQAYIDTSGDIVFRGANAAGSYDAFSATYSNPGYTDGSEYVHLAFVHDSVNNLAKIYDNGIEVVSISTSLGLRLASANGFLVGAGNTGGATEHFDGRIQEPGYTSKVLTAGEIKKLASFRVTHNLTVAIEDQNWLATIDKPSGLASQLDSDWIIDKDTNNIWWYFLDLFSTDIVGIRLKNENASAHVLPLNTFDTGFLSSAPSFPISHGLGTIPTQVEVLHEGQTLAGKFDDVRVSGTCSWDATEITCSTLAAIDGTHRLQIVMSTSTVAVSISVATATNSGLVSNQAQIIAGDKTLNNDLTVVGDINVDVVNERTGAAGVTLDGVLLKDSEVTTDVVNEKTGAAGVTLDGVLLKDSQVTTDVVNEKTGAAGVTLDGVLLKDTEVTANAVNASGTLIIRTNGGSPAVTFETGQVANFNAGIKLPTSGGTADTLNFYETTTYNTTFSLDVLTSASATITLTRIGNLVSMTIPAINVNGAISADPSYTSNTAMPTQFRPTGDNNLHAVRVHDNAPAAALGVLAITTAGFISVYVDGTQGTTFNTSSGPKGFASTDFCFTWVRR